MSCSASMSRLHLVHAIWCLLLSAAVAEHVAPQALDLEEACAATDRCALNVLQRSMRREEGKVFEVVQGRESVGEPITIAISTTAFAVRWMIKQYKLKKEVKRVLEGLVAVMQALKPTVDYLKRLEQEKSNLNKEIVKWLQTSLDALKKELEDWINKNTGWTRFKRLFAGNSKFLKRVERLKEQTDLAMAMLNVNAQATQVETSLRLIMEMLASRKRVRSQRAVLLQVAARLEIPTGDIKELQGQGVDDKLGEFLATIISAVEKATAEADSAFVIPKSIFVASVIEDSDDADAAGPARELTPAEQAEEAALERENSDKKIEKFSFPDVEVLPAEETPDTPAMTRRRSGDAGPPDLDAARSGALIPEPVRPLPPLPRVKVTL